VNLLENDVQNNVCKFVYICYIHLLYSFTLTVAVIVAVLRRQNSFLVIVNEVYPYPT